MTDKHWKTKLQGFVYDTFDELINAVNEFCSNIFVIDVQFLNRTIDSQIFRAVVRYKTPPETDADVPEKADDKQIALLTYLGEELSDSDKAKLTKIEASKRILRHMKI